LALARQPAGHPAKDGKVQGVGEVPVCPSC